MRNTWWTRLTPAFAERRALDETLAAYQSSRDERVKPLYHFTCELAKLERPAGPPLQALFGALHGNREATNEFYSAITGSTGLQQFMNPENLDRIMASAGARR